MPTLCLFITHHWPMIQVRIKNSEHMFIIDTGAQATLITPELGFKLEVLGRTKMEGIGSGKSDCTLVKCKFNILGKTLTSVFVTDRLSEIATLTQFRVSGLLGQDLLSQFNQIEFDYLNKRIKFV